MQISQKKILISFITVWQDGNTVEYNLKKVKPRESEPSQITTDESNDQLIHAARKG